MQLTKFKITNQRDKTNYKIMEVPSNMTLYKFNDVEHTPNAKGVKRFYFVSDLFANNKKMLFLFDYGDSWYFTLELLDNSENVFKTPKNYYKIYEARGEDPEQYPPLDE
ncbi:hypothetical protein KKE34_02150 [Patescibacteria group bacterium]|nr:hypothetical protein [Patescibacteria group bacterium]MBU1885388.1 hypothetical protein [Patescibacteria group bacterium]